jgi:hypothetical protein
VWRWRSAGFGSHFLGAFRDKRVIGSIQHDSFALLQVIECWRTLATDDAAKPVAPLVRDAG